MEEELAYVIVPLEDEHIELHSSRAKVVFVAFSIGGKVSECIDFLASIDDTFKLLHLMLAFRPN